MTDRLPPFSGHDATCPKCDGFMLSRYYPAGTRFESQDYILTGVPGDEWMLRDCGTCGYQFPESCADSQPSLDDKIGRTANGLPVVIYSP